MKANTKIFSGIVSRYGEIEEISQYLKSSGYKVDTFSFSNGTVVNSDVVVDQTYKSSLKSNFDLIRYIYSNYDVFFLFGSPLLYTEDHTSLPLGLDLLLLKTSQKPIIFRLYEEDSYSEELMYFISELSNIVLVNSINLLSKIPNSIYLPLILPKSEYECLSKETILIAYQSEDAEFSSLINEIYAQLKRKFSKLKFIEVNKIDIHNGAKEIDIFIDDTYPGRYSSLSVKLMSLRKTILLKSGTSDSFEKDLNNFFTFYREESLRSIIEDLLNNREKLNYINKKGYEYFLGNHTAEGASDLLNRTFNEIPKKNSLNLEYLTPHFIKQLEKHEKSKHGFLTFLKQLIPNNSCNKLVKFLDITMNQGPRLALCRLFNYIKIKLRVRG